MTHGAYIEEFEDVMADYGAFYVFAGVAFFGCSWLQGSPPQSEDNDYESAPALVDMTVQPADLKSAKTP